MKQKVLVNRFRLFSVDQIEVNEDTSTLPLFWQS